MDFATVFKFLDQAKGYWPFIIEVALLWYVAQVLSKRVWSKRKAARPEAEFVRTMRALMPMWPLLLGAALGAGYPWVPAVEFVGSRGAAVLQGVLAGITSVVGVMALELVARQRGWTVVVDVIEDAVPDEEAFSVPPPPTVLRTGGDIYDDGTG